jgi:hypothetical protein
VSHVLVLVPAGFDPGPLPPGTAIRAYGDVPSAAAALRGTDAPAVICSDALSGDGLAQVAAAVGDRPGQCIEVRSTRWDGEAHSPLAAACRGVISGFGADGVRRAAALLVAGP